VNRWTAKFLPLVLVAVCTLARAQVTYTITTSADAFLATGSPTNPKGPDLTNDNFGIAGVLYIAPAISPNGEYQSVLKFDLSGATNLFNATYGSNWLISGISLELAGNFGAAREQPDNAFFNPINGGNFVIQWLADDDWVEGTGRPNAPTTDGVTYGSLPALLAEAHEILCTNTYVPPGDNVHVTWPLPLNQDLVNDIMAGGPVSFRFYAADNQVSYLFNSHNFGNGNQPLIHVTAIPQLRMISGYFTNGMFHLIAIGGTNLPCQMQASSDLSATNWQTLGTVTADGAGVIQFDDSTVANHNQRYYRLAY
jgi:hypothetical protein